MKIYDADQVAIIAFNIPIQSGYADGEFVRIQQDEKSFKAKKGTDGEVTRSKMDGFLTTVTITLMQTSSSNALLSGILNLDEQGQNGAGVGPLLIADLQGTSIFEASSAWITGPPEVVYDREAEGRAWEIQCVRDVRLDGGN
jgi:structural protein KPP10_ORF10